jgi:chaperonin GroES
MYHILAKKSSPTFRAGRTFPRAGGGPKQSLTASGFFFNVILMISTHALRLLIGFIPLIINISLRMALMPLNDHLVIKPATEEKTVGGILLPETADKERPEKGEVIAVGPGKLLENGSRAPMSVKIGDTVVFKKYSPDEVKVGKEEYLVISESDVLAIVK